MAKLNTKIVMLKGEQGKDGTTIKSVEKTASSGLTDTYTITLTNGSKFSFNVTNGNGIKSIGKTGTSGLVDTYTITFDNGEKSTFTVTNGKNGENGKDGAITNLDATLSTTSTNAIQNKAVANGINSIQSQIDTLKKFPNYSDYINTEWEFHKDPIGLTAFPEELASTKSKMPVGVYAVTYDIFVPNDDTAVSYYFLIQLANSFADGNMFAYNTAEHKIPIMPNSDMVPGTIASFTDIIELTQENYISIWALLNYTTEDDPQASAAIICGSYDMKTINPTIVRLR